MNNLISTAALAASLMVPTWTFAQAESGAVAGRPGETMAKGESMIKGESAAKSETDPKEMQKDFVETAANTNFLEIAEGKLALDRSQDPQVKQLAEMMIRDHEMAQQQLQQAGQSAGAEVPTKMNKLHQMMLDELAKKKGEAFEHCYVYSQVGAHAKAVLEFRDASKELQDAHLKQFAQQTLPHLQMHLRDAENVAGMSDLRPAGKHASTSGNAKHEMGASSGGPEGGAVAPEGTNASGGTNPIPASR